MKMLLLSLCVLSAPVIASAQTTKSISLEECYTLARENYPLVKQQELIAKSKEYSIDNASKGNLPQLNVSGQASYQSATTQVPFQIPGITFPGISKDQYKIYGEVNQVLYDGGTIKNQKQSIEADAGVQQQQLEVELYKLKDRINQLYFGILLVDEQLKQNELLKTDIQTGINKTTGALANGTAFKSNLDMLKAEMLNTNQHSIELKATRGAYTSMLSLFLNKEVDENTVLKRPQDIIVTQDIHRPELLLYDYQTKSLDIQNKMISSKTLPKFNFFVQGGYGRPALNMLSNDFDFYYIGGLRLSWQLSGLYTSKKEKALIDINRKNIGLQKETFLFNTNFTLKQENAEITKLRALLSSDNEIIDLRASVKRASSAQLENGVINANDYLRDVNTENLARQNKILHETQLLMAEYNQQTTTGN
ncbi:TolC family protein [Chitinophagaceae bacterium LWZ2-11]